MVRTYEDVLISVENAKLETSDLLPICQELTFDNNFSGTDFKLMELNKELAESIQVGERLVLRGEVTDSATLCTKSSTYEIKGAETSNSLLILKDLVLPNDAKDVNPNFKSLKIESNTDISSENYEDATTISESLIKRKQILCVAHSYYELRKVKPIFSRIRRILESTSYKGEEYESKDPKSNHEGEKYLTFEQILEKTPASETEFREFLHKARVINVKGFLRLIHSDYLFRVLSVVLNYIDEKRWKRDGIPKNDVIQNLRSIESEFILESIFQWFFSSNKDDSGGEEEIYTIKDYEICRFFGEVILKPVGRFNLEDFLSAWQDSLPEGVMTDLRQLDGLAVIDSDRTPKQIWYMPEHGLPELILDRFSILFDAKPKWRFEELMPFIENFSATPAAAGQLLTKYARVININGTKYYSAKHSK